MSTDERLRRAERAAATDPEALAALRRERLRQSQLKSPMTTR